jgi:hypothetical protein
LLCRKQIGEKILHAAGKRRIEFADMQYAH